ALVVDYSALADARVVSFTPFGILRVDDQRTIYRLVPVTAKMGRLTLRQTAAAPLLHDRSTRRFVCQLPEKLSAEVVAKLVSSDPTHPAPIDLPKIALPGVTLRGDGRGTVALDGKTLIVRLLAPAK